MRADAEVVRARRLAAIGDTAGLVSLVAELARRPRLFSVESVPDHEHAVHHSGHPLFVSTPCWWRADCVGPDGTVISLTTDPGAARPLTVWAPDAPTSPLLAPHWQHHPNPTRRFQWPPQ